VTGTRRCQLYYAAAFIVAALVVPFLSWELRRQGWSATHIGEAGGIMTVTAIVAAPLWGRADDRRPGLALKLALAVTGAAAATLAAVLDSGWQLLGVVAAFGLGSGALEPLATSNSYRILGAKAPIGQLRRAGSIGWIAGLAMAALTATIWRGGPFIVAAVVAFLVAGVARPTRASPPDRLGASGSSLRSVVRLVTSTLAMPTSLFVLTLFTGVFAQRESDSPWGVALPLMLLALLEVPALTAAHHLHVRHGSERLLVFAHLLASAAFAIAAARTNLIGLVAIQPLLALAFACWFVGQTSLIADLAGRALGLSQSLAAVATKGVAGMLVGVFGGRIIDNYGFVWLFTAVSLALLIGGWVNRLVVTSLPIVSSVEPSGPKPERESGST
jgi:hypothetical protein